MANIAIFLSSDNNYAPFVATTIASICDNTKSFCDFYILDGGITEENQKKICELKKQFLNFSIEFIKIDDSMLSSITYKNMAQHVTLSTYNRFLIPNLKPNIAKTIYLDVDIIASGDISELYNEDIEDYDLGAVWREFSKETNLKFMNDRLKLPSSHKYFNAGVLLINCDNWRKKNIVNKLFEIEEQYREVLELADQDVLNIVFCESYKNLDFKYNYQTQYYMSHPSTKFILRHYSDAIKPWNLNPQQDTNLLPDNLMFWKYADLTAFGGDLKKYYKQDAIRLLQVKRLMEKNLIKKIEQKIKVSVIIPVYNAEKYLRKCLDSIINQTLRELEIICINDCSTDNSLNILNEYAKNDKRIKIINFEKNRGVSVARNKGIKEAKGEYIGFVDSDDFIDLDFYEKLYSKAKEKNAQVAKGTFNIITDNYSTISDMNLKIRKNIINFFGEFYTAIYESGFIKENNLYFPEDISTFEDPLFSIKVAKKIKSLVFDETAIYNYIRHDGSKSHEVTLKRINDRLKCARLILEEIDNENDYKIVLNDLILYVLFILSFNLKDTEKKEIMKNGIKELLLLRPEFNFERDYDKLYKKWYFFKMQTMAEKIRTSHKKEI